MPPLSKQQFGEKMTKTLKDPVQTSGAWESKVLGRGKNDSVWRGPIGTSHQMSSNRSRDI